MLCRALDFGTGGPTIISTTTKTSDRKREVGPHLGGMAVDAGGRGLATAVANAGNGVHLCRAGRSARGERSAIFFGPSCRAACIISAGRAEVWDCRCHCYGHFISVSTLVLFGLKREMSTSLCRRKVMAIYCHVSGPIILYSARGPANVVCTACLQRLIRPNRHFHRQKVSGAIVPRSIIIGDIIHNIREMSFFSAENFSRN